MKTMQNLINITTLVLQNDTLTARQNFEFSNSLNSIVYYDVIQDKDDSDYDFNSQDGGESSDSEAGPVITSTKER